MIINEHWCSPFKVSSESICVQKSPPYSLSPGGYAEVWGSGPASEFPFPPLQVFPLTNPPHSHALLGSGGPSHHISMVPHHLTASIIVVHLPTLTTPLHRSSHPASALPSLSLHSLYQPYLSHIRGMGSAPCVQIPALVLGFQGATLFF
jgi:hypothetical protein